MNITEALQGTYGLRIVCGDKWLYWDAIDKSWVVRKQKRGSYSSVVYTSEIQYSTVLCMTENEEEAVAALLDD